MSSTTDSLSRRSLLRAAGGLSLGAALAPALIASPAGATGGQPTPPPETPATPGAAADDAMENLASQVSDALEAAYGRQSGLRRNHATGIGVLGHFTGNEEAAVHSRSTLFSGQRVEVVGRFSIGGGDPASSGTEKSVRGAGFEFRLPGGELHHMTLINTPMFFASTPQTFLAKFQALRIDPATGQANPALLTQFNAQYPEVQAQDAYLASMNPPANYASAPYFGVHAFHFVNAAGQTTPVKLRFEPVGGRVNLTDAQVASLPADFLNQALIDRLRRGPAEWDLILTLGEPGDDQTNPVLQWPSGRREVRAGRLTLDRAIPDPRAGSYKINYDPLMLSDGVEPSPDPVLLFRSPSYASSHERRLREL